MFFKSAEEKKNEALLDNVVASLKNQISTAVAVAQFGEDDTSQYDERIRDNFTWGYINGFLWSFLNTLSISREQKELYVRKALKKLFPSFGVSVMAEVKNKKDETIMFGLGEEWAEEDFKRWAETNEQPKRLGEFILRGDKAIDFDGL
jgi:hypothetical protein